MMIGRRIINLPVIIESQIEFQKAVTGEQRLPYDCPGWMQYHVTGMIEELGEVLKADKRWKTHRNKTYDMAEKKDEIADVFIEAINIAIFSGLSAEDLTEVVYNKIQQNKERLRNENTRN